jgi:transcription initiation factor TFIIIB Brf1 subunit/transcription initiation factor TFIIB
VSEPSEMSRKIVKEIADGLVAGRCVCATCSRVVREGAEDIDAYVAHRVEDERARVLACGRHARDWKEWTRMIEDGVWPYEGEM